MDRLIKNIMKRIAEKREDYYLNDDIYDPIAVDALDFACDVIEEEVKEYNNGWIPCSERLPAKNQKCLIHYMNNDYIDIDTFDGERFSFFGKGVIAWQPLPPVYKKGE